MVGTGDGVKRPICVWNVPSPYEDDWLSWPDRQALRRASNNAELEHDDDDRADFEEPGEHAIAVILSVIGEFAPNGMSYSVDAYCDLRSMA